MNSFNVTVIDRNSIEKSILFIIDELDENKYMTSEVVAKIIQDE